MIDSPDLAPADRAAGLTIWTGPVTVEPLAGGITNRNFLVADGGERFVVRIGRAIPVHHVMRFNERAQAAPPTPPTSLPKSSTLSPACWSCASSTA